MPSIKFLLEWPLSARQLGLASSRQPIIRERFVAELASTETGKAAADLLWDKLNDAKVCDEFVPYPDDDLLWTYGLADEDLDDDIILAILVAVTANIPDEPFLKRFGPVDTPRDIIRLIEASDREIRRFQR